MALIPRPVQLPQIQGGPNFGQAIAAGLQGFNAAQSIANAAQQREAQRIQMETAQMQQAQMQQELERAQQQRSLQDQAIASEQLLISSNPEEGIARLQAMEDQSPAAQAILQGLRGGTLSFAQAQQAAGETMTGAQAMGLMTPIQQARQAEAERLGIANKEREKGLEKAETELRKEFLTLAGKSLLEGREQIAKIREAKKTGVGDVSLMKTINKMIDSGIVTDSDFDQVAQSSGLADTFEGLRNKIFGGGSLNDVTRRQIVEQAEQLWSAKVRSAKDIATGIDADAEAKGFERSVIPRAFQTLFERETERQAEQASRPERQTFVTSGGLQVEVR